MDAAALRRGADDIAQTFENAAIYVRNASARLDSQKLLYFYGRFKQAKEGQCSTPKPGFFDFQGKEKWEAWKSLGDMSKQQAMAEYIAAVADLDAQWEGKIGVEESKGSGMGVSVSTMQGTAEAMLPDKDKSPFDWCKEGNQAAVQKCLRSGLISPSTKDECGLTLLHWACDRGFYDVADCLIANGADVNCVDPEGQTPLHYASSCEHVELVSLLLARGCDASLPDSEGRIASSNTTNPAIKKLLGCTS